MKIRPMLLVAVCGLSLSIAGCEYTVDSPRTPGKRVPYAVATLEAQQVAAEIMAERDKAATELASKARKTQRDAKNKLADLEADFRRQAAAVAAEADDVAADITDSLARIQAEADRKAKAVQDSTGLAITESQAAMDRKFAVAQGVLEAGQASGVPIVAGLATTGLAGLGWLMASVGRKKDSQTADQRRADAVAAERARFDEHKTAWDEATRTAGPTVAPQVDVGSAVVSAVNSALSVVLDRVLPKAADAPAAPAQS